jgi:hypothetical protein
MVNSVSSSQNSHASETAKPAQSKPQPTPQREQKSSPLPSDTVSLKSPSNAKNGGDKQ